MKTYTIPIIFALAILISCQKEKPVVIDHPISADIESGKQTVSVPFVWVDLSSDDNAGDALDEEMKNGGSQVAVIVTGDGFQGGAEAWFDSHKSAWPNATYNMQTSSGGLNFFVASSREGATLRTIDINGTNVIEMACKEFVIALGKLQENDMNQLLNQIWYGTDKTAAILALMLDNESTRLQDATFVNCLATQFGKINAAGSQNIYLYTSAGTWNDLGGMNITKLGDSGEYNTVRCNINVEEGRI